MLISEELAKAKDIIESHGYTVIEDYLLINNYGIVFSTDGNNRIDARHWKNCYGAEMNSYSISLNLVDYPELKVLKPEMEILEQELNNMIHTY